MYTRASAARSLTGNGRSPPTHLVASCAGSWQEASVPHRVDPSIDWLQDPQNVATAFPQSEWSERECRAEVPLSMT